MRHKEKKELRARSQMAGLRAASSQHAVASDEAHRGYTDDSSSTGDDEEEYVDKYRYLLHADDIKDLQKKFKELDAGLEAEWIAEKEKLVPGTALAEGLVAFLEAKHRETKEPFLQYWHESQEARRLKLLADKAQAEREKRDARRARRAARRKARYDVAHAEELKIQRAEEERLAAVAAVEAKRAAIAARMKERLGLASGSDDSDSSDEGDGGGGAGRRPAAGGGAPAADSAVADGGGGSSGRAGEGEAAVAVVTKGGGGWAARAKSVFKR